MQIFIAYAIFTSLSWIKSTTFTPMVSVGELSSFRSSLVGKLLGYQEVVVHDYDDENTDKMSQKDVDGQNGDIEKASNEKLSLFNSGTV